MSLEAVDAFFLALEEMPGDPLTLQALADWYEESGQQENAACLRWCAQRGLFPFRYTAGEGLVLTSTMFREGWFWWATDAPGYGSDWGHPPHCRLPRAVWRQLKNTAGIAALVFTHFQTLRAAYEALFAAWPRLTPADREVPS